MTPPDPLQPETGPKRYPCCLPDGSCAMLSEDRCAILGGETRWSCDSGWEEPDDPDYHGPTYENPDCSCVTCTKPTEVGHCCVWVWLPEMNDLCVFVGCFEDVTKGWCDAKRSHQDLYETHDPEFFYRVDSYFDEDNDCSPGHTTGGEGNCPCAPVLGPCCTTCTNTFGEGEWASFSYCVDDVKESDCVPPPGGDCTAEWRGPYIPGTHPEGGGYWDCARLAREGECGFFHHDEDKVDDPSGLPNQDLERELIRAARKATRAKPDNPLTRLAKRIYELIANGLDVGARLLNKYDRDRLGPSYGACCCHAGCTDGLTIEQCEQGGDSICVYMGDGTVCPQECPETGACCTPGSTHCVRRPEAQCADLNGFYHGDGVSCYMIDCHLKDVGACCYEDDEFCFEGSLLHCSQIGGDFQGEGSLCKFAPCGQPDPDERKLLIKNDRDEWEDKDSRSYVIRGRQYVLAGEDAEQSCDCCEGEPPPPGNWCDMQGCHQDQFAAVRVSGSVKCRSLPWANPAHLGGGLIGCEGFYGEDDDPKDYGCPAQVTQWPFGGYSSLVSCEGMNDQTFARRGVGQGEPCNLTFTAELAWVPPGWGYPGSASGSKVLYYGDCSVLHGLEPKEPSWCVPDDCTQCDHCRWAAENDMCCVGGVMEKYMYIHYAVGSHSDQIGGKVGCPPYKLDGTPLTCNDCRSENACSDANDPVGEDACTCGGCSECNYKWWPNDGIWEEAHTSDGSNKACYEMNGTVRGSGFCDEFNAWRCQYDYCDPEDDNCPGGIGFCDDHPGQGKGSSMVWPTSGGFHVKGTSYGISTSLENCDIKVINPTSNDHMSSGTCGNCAQHSFYFDTLSSGCERHCGCNGNPNTKWPSMGPGLTYGYVEFRSLEFLTYAP
jgi:hypothetical protein